MTKKILTLTSAFLAVVLVSFFINNPLTSQEQSDTLKFIGRFHPAILHLPIGFFVVLAVFEFLSPLPFMSKLKGSASIILALTILATLLAVFTGFMLAYASGSSEPLVVYHMQASLILGILSLVLGVLKLHQDKILSKLAYPVTLLAALVVLFISSHNGGSITHGEDYLTKYMPNSLRPWFGVETEEKPVVAALEDLIVYQDVIHQVFEQNCNTCHNPNKKKGEYNMETYEGLMKGGEMGYSIAAGDLEDSELYFRITLPQDDEDFMPTDGKPPLSEVEVQLIGWWIEQGADPEKTVGEFSDIPAPIHAYFQKMFDSMVTEEELEARENRREQLYEELETVQENLGIVIIPVTPEASEFSIETFAVQKTFDDASLAQLEPFASAIVEADLSGTQITDQSLKTLSKFTNLQSLNLSKTQIKGLEMSELASLKKLESLNLYGTQISKERINQLAQLTQLKNLYLFQTELYEASTLAELKEALPDCNFVLN